MLDEQTNCKPFLLQTLESPRYYCISLLQKWLLRYFEEEVHIISNFQADRTDVFVLFRPTRNEKESGMFPE